MIQLTLVSPGKGPMALTGQLWATLRAELVMQWRRWGLWLAFGIATIITALMFAAFARVVQHPAQLTRDMHFNQEDYVNLFVTVTTNYTELVLAVVAALLVADRLIRDRQSGIIEIQRATTQSYPIYVFGKFIGNLIALLVPAFIAYMLCGTELVALGMSSDVFPGFARAFLLVYIPAFCIVVALTLFLSSMVPLRVVQIGFPLLWMYATLSPLHWTTLHDTIFTPAGRYIFPIFFPTPFTRGIPGSSPTLAALNIVALIGSTFVFLVLLVLSLHLQTCKESVG